MFMVSVASWVADIKLNLRCWCSYWKLSHDGSCNICLSCCIQLAESTKSSSRWWSIAYLSDECVARSRSRCWRARSPWSKPPERLSSSPYLWGKAQPPLGGNSILSAFFRHSVPLSCPHHYRHQPARHSSLTCDQDPEILELLDTRRQLIPTQGGNSILFELRSVAVGHTFFSFFKRICLNHSAQHGEPAVWTKSGPNPVCVN